jgi:hypothetical protein
MIRLTFELTLWLITLSRPKTLAIALGKGKLCSF